MSTAPTFIFENEEGYKKLFDNAHDLIYFARPDGRLIYVNSSWLNVLGYGQEEIEGKSIDSFIDENDREHFYCCRDGLPAGIHQQERIVITLIAHDGRPVKAEGFILVQYAQGEAIYTTGIFRDVTKNLENENRLQRSNEQLKQSESELQQLLIYAPDAIVVINQDGDILFWNPKAEQMFGWASGEVLGTDLTDTIVPPKHREGHNRGMKRFLQTGVPHVINRTVEITALKKSGEEFDVALTVSTTKQRGKVAFIAFIRDITDQKNNERELERSRKELQASNQQLEQFAHVASHDMKEPIRKIKTFSSLISSECGESLPDNAKNYLEKIQRSAHRLSSMVEGVLTYSTLTNTSEPFETVNLDAVIRQIEDDLEVLVQQKGAQIHHHNLPAVHGVPFLIYQLFYNLINNSLKFSQATLAPKIVIRAQALREGEPLPPGAEAGTSYVNITLSDNGIGFDQGYSERIFNTFARLNAKDKYEGTGLGLALCKNIAERHHGSITAKGREGVGATFTIILPGKFQNI